MHPGILVCFREVESEQNSVAINVFTKATKKMQLFSFRDINRTIIFDM